MKTSSDELEQTYRRIYLRLIVGMFVVYGAALGLALKVLLGHAVTYFL